MTPGSGEILTARLPESTDQKGRKFQYDPTDYKGKILDESEKQKFKFYPDSYKGKIQDAISNKSDEEEVKVGADNLNLSRNAANIFENTMERKETEGDARNTHQSSHGEQCVELTDEENVNIGEKMKEIGERD